MNRIKLKKENDWPKIVSAGRWFLFWLAVGASIHYGVYYGLSYYLTKG